MIWCYRNHPQRGRLKSIKDEFKSVPVLFLRLGFHFVLKQFGQNIGRIDEFLAVSIR